MQYNLLFCWFVGREMDDEVWDVTVFTKNRERLICASISQQLLDAVLVEARKHGLSYCLGYGWSAARFLTSQGIMTCLNMRGSGHTPTWRPRWPPCGLIQASLGTSPLSRSL